MDLTGLNNMQKKAVERTDGPVLILAGAGSGKTTVLVNRVAYIIETKNIHPYNILAITFTNKAANEMKDRVTAIIGDLSKDMWICTFHAACVRILRSHIGVLGFLPGFVIYDSADTKTVMKECYKELDIDEKNYPYRSVLAVISKAKDELLTPDEFYAEAKGDYRKTRIGEIYELYQKKLKANNALDFDDILFYTVKILEENPDILEKYQERFQYIMVDEYQDTNNCQYRFVSMLAKKHRNICVVGDDDQSIYKFRGANIQNILDFEDTFDDCAVIKLEQNYRSTGMILDAANAVIHNNKGRKDKSLWTENERGDKIKLHIGYNERDEALYIASEIEKAHQMGEKYADFTVLYRTNAQSRILEEIFMRSGIPYKVVGGLRFYDRKEIKDIIAYLRLIHNPNDSLSFERIVNEPKRSIGKTTVEKVAGLASDFDTSSFEIAKNAHSYTELSRSAAGLIEFCAMISALKKAEKTMPLTDFVEKVLNDTGYMSALVLENTVESKTRTDNLGEFISAVSEYEKTEEIPTLEGFLENVSLVSDIDGYDEDDDTCTFMTIHSAKGLEFPNVFLSGMEEGLFPSIRSMDNSEDLEEERRLCYVAITRAKKQLYVTAAKSRTLYGQTTHQTNSRFLKEIPSEYLKEDGIMPVDRLSDSIQIPQTVRRAKAEVFGTISNASSFASPKINFSAGERVRHQKFGDGTITAVQRFEKDALLEVKFDSGEVKRLMAALAKLEKI